MFQTCQNRTWKEGLGLVIAEKLNIIFSACRLGTEQLRESTVLECSLWGVSTDSAFTQCLLQRLYKNSIYAFVAGCQNWKYQPRSFKYV